jgi:hypothetical protein
MRRLLILAVAVVGLSGCAHPLAVISEASYRHAVAVGATRLLTERGYPVAGRLRCQATSPDEWRTVSVSCTGRTTADAVIQLSGRVTRADTTHPVENYELRIDGRPVATATHLTG